MAGLHELTAPPIWGPFLSANVFPQLVIVWGSSVTHAELNNSAQLILQGHGVFWLSHWFGTSIFWEDSKFWSQLLLGHFLLCKHGQLLQLLVPHRDAVRTNCTNHENW